MCGCKKKDLSPNHYEVNSNDLGPNEGTLNDAIPDASIPSPTPVDIDYSSSSFQVAPTNSGVIVGMIIVCAALIAVIIFIIWLLIRTYRPSRNKDAKYKSTDELPHEAIS